MTESARAEMDGRVYDVEVCGGCGAQLQFDAQGQGDWAPCFDCGSSSHRTLRVHVTRETVLAEIKPRTLLIERSLYFGCIRQAGHHYWTQGLQHLRRDAAATPWGYSVDGGLFPKGAGPRHQGEAHVFHKDGWTAIAFLDRSVDSRGGSWSVFCIPATLDGPDALDLAREAFPTIFARYEFPVTLA